MHQTCLQESMRLPTSLTLSSQGNASPATAPSGAVYMGIVDVMQRSFWNSGLLQAGRRVARIAVVLQLFDCARQT